MRRKALIDGELLSYVASIYYESSARTGDHRQAFVETVRRALLEGYQPHAAWVTDAMLRTGRPTHAVLLSHPEASMVFSVVVGGVSVGWADQLLESEVYTPETGRGWRLIEGEAVELYMRWARQEPEPPQLELNFAMGMELSPEERAKRVEAARYARGTMGLVDGCRPSQLTRELQARWIDGEITIDQAIDEVRRSHGLPDLQEPAQG